MPPSTTFKITFGRAGADKRERVGVQALICHPLGIAIEGAAILHEAAPNLPIILATGSARSVDAPALATAGVTNVVHYPLVTTELAEALAQCLESRVSS